MPKFIQTLTPRRKIDQIKHWGEPDIIAQPDFDLKGFQKKINKIVGLSADGKEIIRCRWAWDADCFSLFYTKWLPEGTPIDSEMRAKYRFTTLEVDSETKVDICPPRFVMEERLDPAQYYDSWEANRWQYDAKLKRKVPLRPAPPREGYYMFWYFVSLHDPGNKCCFRAAKSDAECYGLYREPGQIDLDGIAAIRGKLDRDKNRPNPYAPIGPEVLQAVQRDTEAAEKDRAEARRAAGEENRREYENILAPEVAYSLPPAKEKRTAEGLILLD
jgi:hypothetical protein